MHLKDIRKQCHPETVIALIGNKRDLTEKEAYSPFVVDSAEVTEEEANQFAEENGLLSFRISVKTGKNVYTAFEKVTREVIIKIQNGRLDPKPGGYFNIKIKEPLKKLSSPFSCCSIS